jgi:hypothetical protein
MIGRPTCEVDFVGCLALKCHVRSVFVIPVAEEQELASEGVALKRHQDSSRGFVLQRFDEAFNDGDAAVLAKGSEARRDAMSLALLSIAFTRPELTSFVANQVLGSSLGVVNRSTEKGANGFTGWLLGEHGNSHTAA